MVILSSAFIVSCTRLTLLSNTMFAMFVVGLIRPLQCHPVGQPYRYVSFILGRPGFRKLGVFKMCTFAVTARVSTDLAVSIISLY